MDFEKPVLLGLSGGCDSLALFYLLKECKKIFPFQFGLAHIDHGWRLESGDEARQLKKLAEKHGLPFHLKELKNVQKEGNLEAFCREERIAFFKELSTSFGYQAVLLAHQLNDQTETVLKNFLEGAGLDACNGIEGVLNFQGLNIWRPLLGFYKKQLADFLASAEVTPFVDETNFDQKFLRARMRETVIPFLERSFGKNVCRSLESLGRDCQELKNFLHRYLANVLWKVKRGPFGCWIDFSPFLARQQEEGGKSGFGMFELKFLIREISKMEGCFPSKEIVHDAASHLFKDSSNKCFSMRGHQLFVDRMRFFVLKPEVLDFGYWQIKKEVVEEDVFKRASNWQDLLQGCGNVAFAHAEKELMLAPAQLKSAYGSSLLADWFCQNKVPCFLRKAIPVLWSGNSIVHEFLTGRQLSEEKKNSCSLKITLVGKGKGGGQV